MTEQLYRSDSPVIDKIRRHFERQTRASAPPARGEAARLPPLPSSEHLARILEETFWASLQKEEGRSIILSLAFVTPEWCRNPFVLGSPLLFNAEQLMRIAPAVERPGIHLGVAPCPDGILEVWGHTQRIPQSSFVLEAAGPGLLVVKHRRDGAYSKFVNVAVLSGNEAKFIREEAGSTLDSLLLFAYLLGGGSAREERPWGETAEMLVRLALSMQSHGHGGTLLVVPDGDEGWTASIAQPIKHRAGPYFRELRDLNERPSAHKKKRKYRDALARAVDAIGGLTAVDGAAIITDRLEVVGFGAKIRRRDGGASPANVMVAEPVDGNTPKLVPLWSFGGTRHQSAAQFVHDQHAALALVSSQDGWFTALVWSEAQQMVIAHRVDVLLL